MNNKIALESLVMDLKRVALGYHRGSLKMASRFSEEALKRKNEIDVTNVKPYIKTLLTSLDTILTNKDPNKIADDTLMTSTLLQNYISSL
jgi:hypothetical protein